MSTGKVVSHPTPFSTFHGASSATAPFLGGSTHTNMPLTPPDSPSSDDDEKGLKTVSISTRKHDSSSGSDVEGDEDENYAHNGCTGGANDVGGILIDSRAWKGDVSSGAPSESSASASLSVGGRKEGHHVSGEGGGRDPRSATVCVMQQKGGAQSPMSTLSESCQSSSPMGGPPLRSVLKRSGQRSRGHRVSINEAKNEVVEADYVILVRDEDEPQLVSIRTFDLGLNSPPVDQVTLSPPEGYKDVFGHAIRETIDDSDTENGGVDGNSGWGIKIHDPDCPRANLPDVVVSPRCGPPSLTVENVRHHDQMMEDNQPQNDENKIVKTGILKGGKFWKNGGEGRRVQKIESDKIDKGDEPRRSVRFSGRDEYTTLESADMSYDKIPFEMANEAALACFLSPKFKKLGELLGEQQGDWHVELSPLAIEHAINELDSMANDDDIIHHPTCAKHHHKLDEHHHHHQMDDEQISESVQRYDEMRRRIAAAEGRDNNSICSDESKSSSDSHSSDSPTTESRIRRLENTDVAQVAGGVMRSNSEVRRAIERNALRRSLIRFAEARKKDTNKNDKSDKQDSSLLEKLKWLTASEDATNGNANEPTSENDQESSSQENVEEEESKPQKEESKINCTIEQYRRLAEMFNRTTSLRVGDISVPGDVREWKLESDLFPCEKIISDLENDELPPGTLTYTAVPAVSVCDQISDDESEKLIYSGGIRYTKEGTLPIGANGTTKNGLTVPRERSIASESYSMDDIDEVLHDDRSSSVPSSSQSSPRLSGRSDVDGTSTAESGYSSNETNSELSQMLPPELDELAEFVKQDAGRMERLRKRYDEPEDHGFCRRPSVRGIKPRFGSTTDLLKQMANQLIPPNVSQTSVTGSHMTWPYRDVGDEDNSRTAHQRRKVTATRNNALPALQEDVPYATPPDILYNQGDSVDPSIGPSSENKPLRIVHVYSSTGDLRAHAPPRLPLDSNESLRQINQVPPQRAQSYSSLPQVTQYVSTHMNVPNQGIVGPSEHHHPTCISRRPASVHGHAPTDMLVSGPQHPTPRPLHTATHNSYPRAHCQSHEDLGSIKQDPFHAHYGPRGSYAVMGPGNQYQPNIMHDHHNNVPITYQHSPQNQGSQIDIQSPSGHQSSNNYASKRLPSGQYERSYCLEYHSSSSNPNFVHNSHVHHLPIVSSQMSYTTPIVPEARHSEANMVNGMLIKMDMERGVPEGASSSPRVIMDSQYHPPARESGMLHHHPPQVMNVST